MLKRISILFLLALLIKVESVFTQTTLAGGRGIVRVQSARTIQAGSIFLNSYFLSYFNNTPQFGNDKTWNIGLTYGWKDNLELTAQFVPYQDDQRDGWSPPGDTKLGIKWHTPLSGSRVHSGLRGFLILPTAPHHNVPFEPYSEGKPGLGAMGLLSLQIPGGLPVRIDANVGYLDHNIGTFPGKSSTDQVLFGLGFKIPVRAIIFYSEFTGEYFINNENVAFANNSMRLTHGIKLRVPFNLLLDVGADINFSKKQDVYPPPLHEYADWKVYMGLTYEFLTKRVFGFAQAKTKANRDKENRLLNELRSQRERVDDVLDEMLRELQDESTEGTD